ncbi:MAG: DNA helicase UvrD [Nevskiales bacterium]|nr:DNA helicase UvrD [Nevskiales bacterium]
MTEGWSAEKQRFLLASHHALALGGPGSGKTHIALVKARDEVRLERLKPGQKILFLSFARPTVARIIEKASQLLSREDVAHLEISTYHGFAWTILRSHAYLLNGKPAIRLLPPPEAAAHLTDIAKANQEAEKRRLFEREGKLHFDLFARLVADLFSTCRRLAAIYVDSYPIVILDEFQDTNADEWAMIQQFGRGSRLIALADPEQRIYEFRGADPRRLSDFLAAFKAETFDFSGENHRSNGTDITTFGNDLLRGTHRGKEYAQVQIVRYGFLANRSPHFSAKAAVCNTLRRLRDVPEKSVAILVPSKRLMLEFSAYLSGSTDGLPELHHDVAMDAEPPALAAGIIASILEGGSEAKVSSLILSGLYTQIRGRRGGKATPQGELDLADALSNFVTTGKVTGAKRKRIIQDVQRIASERACLVFSGDPEEDWLRIRRLLESSTEPALKQVAEDAKYIRLLHRGSVLRTNLGAIWRTNGSYVGAQEAVGAALVQEHFAAAHKDWRGIHLMTIHKSKGKEFDAVIIYDGVFQRIVRDASNEQACAQARLALRVAVTRAMRHACIVTPRKDPCPLL